MKKFISLFLSISLILLVACSDEQADIYSAHMTMTDTENEEITEDEFKITEDGFSGTLEISAYSGGDGATWYDLILGFKELHPNVKIILNGEIIEDNSDIGNETDNSNLDYLSYSNKLKIDLAAGEGPDLIIGNFDFASEIAKSGLLADLYSFMESDETFNKEDYFTNVFEAAENYGGLYKMPTTFLPNAYYRFNVEILESVGVDPEAIEIADYEFVYDVYNKAVANGEFKALKYIDKYGAWGKQLGMRSEYIASFDLENNTANFDTPTFRDCLETVYNYNASPTPRGNITRGMIINILGDETYFAEILTGEDFFSVSSVIEHENATRAYPMLSSSGELTISGRPYMSIPSTTKNAALSWEFIKYCIAESEKVERYVDSGLWNGDRFFDAIPINKANAEKYIDKTFNGYKEEYAQEFKVLLEEMGELKLNLDLSFHQLALTNNETIYEYFDDLISLDECIKALQDRTDIYFGEIG